MKNERGAGRKPIISDNQLDIIKQRLDAGESVTGLAREYGVSRQALYKRLNSKVYMPVAMEYFLEGNATALIEVDTRKEQVHLLNYSARISDRPFGLNNEPGWRELGRFFEDRILESKGLYLEPVENNLICNDRKCDSFSLKDVVNSAGDTLRIKTPLNEFPEEELEEKIFHFEKKDILYTRSDTDGFQMKAISRDRKWFVKAQAIISGVVMDDWAVEIIAADLCRQLGIDHVGQKECSIIYAGRKLKGVYSQNFELDGYTFISFESLINQRGYSTKDDYFIHMDSISKLRWCAEKLHECGNVGSGAALKYMIDLALIDCLCGNTDRHTRNFGLFFNVMNEKFEIPLIFDCGMGMFEHDPYKDRYKDYEQAMMTVYVAPYGEDPFDMIKILFNEFDMLKLYPQLGDIQYNSRWESPFAHEYMVRMMEMIRKLIEGGNRGGENV